MPLFLGFMVNKPKTRSAAFLPRGAFKAENCGFSALFIYFLIYLEVLSYRNKQRKRTGYQR